MKPFGAVDDSGGARRSGVLLSDFSNASEPAASVLDTYSSRLGRRFQFITAREGRALHHAVLEKNHDCEARGFCSLPRRTAEGKRLIFYLLSGAFLGLAQGARSERRPRSGGLAARPWRFRSASSTLVSGMALSVLHVGWKIRGTLHCTYIEPRFVYAFYGGDT